MAKIGYGANTIGVSKLYKLHELKRFFNKHWTSYVGNWLLFEGVPLFLD